MPLQRIAGGGTDRLVAMDSGRPDFQLDDDRPDARDALRRALRRALLGHAGQVAAERHHAVVDCHANGSGVDRRIPAQLVGHIFLDLKI
ncbi:hypothetical protein D9M68_354630 [compost metagenome]